MSKVYEACVAELKKRLSIRPKVGLILGTGLGPVADELLEDKQIVPYSDVMGFPRSTAPGHKGRFAGGYVCGVPVLIMQGRVHFYEGYSMAELAVPVQVMRELGIDVLIVTNASGGICTDYSPGDIVSVSDHIKFDLDSPMRGMNDEKHGERFFSMNEAYSPRLRKIAADAAARAGINLYEGVYAYMGGPQFETPAEINMLRLLGADLVGMSTVPEVITAAHCGMETLCLSCVTNMAAGLPQGGLNAEVIADSEIIGAERMAKLLKEIIAKL